LEIALDLFQGALQVQLESERGGELLLLQSRSADSNETGAATRVSLLSSEPDSNESSVPSNESMEQQQQQALSFVALAEWHVQRLPEYLNGHNVYVPHDNQMHEVAFPSSTVTTIPLEHRDSFVPYLCQEAMLITSRVLSVGDETSQQLIVGSIVVFNLALVHQLRRRNCVQASSLYELSASLLQSVSTASPPPQALQVTWPLRLALLNNFGVWCYDNGDGECMLTCMEYLRIALDATAATPTKSRRGSNNASDAMDDASDDDATRDNDKVERGMRSNINRILTPHHGSSPAA
jgi:hypothetical protein